MKVAIVVAVLGFTTTAFGQVAGGITQISPQRMEEVERTILTEESGIQTWELMTFEEALKIHNGVSKWEDSKGRGYWNAGRKQDEEDAAIVLALHYGTKEWLYRGWDNYQFAKQMIEIRTRNGGRIVGYRKTMRKYDEIARRYQQIIDAERAQHLQRVAALKTPLNDVGIGIVGILSAILLYVCTPVCVCVCVCKCVCK